MDKHTELGEKQETYKQEISIQELWRESVNGVDFSPRLSATLPMISSFIFCVFFLCALHFNPVQSCHPGIRDLVTNNSVYYSARLIVAALEQQKMNYFNDPS